MNWDAIGAVGEIVGAAAVVASLVYLAVQIRAQSRETRVSAMHDISVGFRDAISRFAAEDATAIFVKANKDYDSLTDVEAQRLIILFGLFSGVRGSVYSTRRGSSGWSQLALHN